jgi:hypothetical protein
MKLLLAALVVTVAGVVAALVLRSRELEAGRALRAAETEASIQEHHLALRDSLASHDGPGRWASERPEMVARLAAIQAGLPEARERGPRLAAHGRIARSLALVGGATLVLRLVQCWRAAPPSPLADTLVARGFAALRRRIARRPARERLRRLGPHALYLFSAALLALYLGGYVLLCPRYSDGLRWFRVCHAQWQMTLWTPLAWVERRSRGAKWFSFSCEPNRVEEYGTRVWP